MSEIAKIVGERLRHKRQELRYSQEVVAEKAGLHPTYIGQVERGEKNATIESIEKLCLALEYPMEELFAKIAVTNEQEAVANQCFSLIVSQPPKEQEQLLTILKHIVEYKIDK